MPIASGVYQHRDNGIANGITETWQINRHTATTYRQQITFKAHYTLTADVLFDDDFNMTDFIYKTDDGLNGHYQINDNQLWVKRTLAGNTRLEDKLVWSAETILDLPFLSCKGHTILHLNQYGTVPTFAPLLRSGDRAGDLAKKSVTSHGDSKVIMIDTAYTAIHYHYMRDYWLDTHGMVLRAVDKTYEMILVEYQR